MKSVLTGDNKSPCEMGAAAFTDPGTITKPPTSSSSPLSSSPASAAF
jgi:hypothetical protein